MYGRPTTSACHLSDAVQKNMEYVRQIAEAVRRDSFRSADLHLQTFGLSVGVFVFFGGGHHLGRVVALTRAVQARTIRPVVLAAAAVFAIGYL